MIILYIIYYLHAENFLAFLVESEKVFSMKVIHEESPFPCDYVKNAFTFGG